MDLESLIYNHLKTGDFIKAITGDIYKIERPANSLYEDVVISMLPINNLQLQTGVANVNIHVPNLLINVNGVQQEMANISRLKQLFSLAQNELKETLIDDVIFNIQQQIFFQEQESSYINIRLDIYSVNILN